MNFSSVNKKNWILKKFDNQKALEISEKFSLKEITSRLLAIRNINMQDVELFLNPTIRNLMPNPYQITDMKNAVLRISEALEKKEVIGIFGDYDVDGAASTAIIAKYLNLLKQNFKTYIPDRKKDGYGPNVKGFEELIKKGSKSIITVDCGTSSFEAIEYAKNLNVDVIVLDHHQSGTLLPKAHSIVNPNRLDDISNLNYLCAAGVCFMFLAALNKNLKDSNWFNKNDIKEPNIINFLDLVCLGTICDVVPLVGLNRAIVAQGLKIIKNRSNLGIKTLYDLCNIQSQPNCYHIGYQIGPRINAGGRVGKSSYGAELLISNNAELAYKIACNLDIYNNERKKLEEKLLTFVESDAEKIIKDPVLVLSGNDWHEGIIGIIASRIKDKFQKPTLIISFNGNEGKGSARSVYGFDIGAVIIAAVQAGILIKGGGHKMAGGFSIEKNKVLELKEFLNKKYSKISPFLKKTNNLYLDATLSASALNEDFYNDIQLLSPFGPGNSEPTFVVENLKIANSMIVGNKHIKTVMYSPGGKTIKGIAFNSKDSVLENYLSTEYKKSLNVLGKLSLNEWQGKRNIEFIIQDVALS